MKTNNLKFLSLFLGASLMGLFFQNCSQPGSLQITAASTVAPADSGLATNEPPTTTGDKTYIVSTTPSSKFICEPFGGGSQTQAKNGLKAQLSYIDASFGLSADTKNAYSVLNYFKAKDPFVQVDTPIYLSQINVPSRSFDQGFKLSDGTYLSDMKGNKLIEYFGIKMQSVLKLSDTDADGVYELATISDDGSILYIGSQDVSTATPFINNDGAHSTRMKCATKTITMDHSTRLPITYFYNQGPRTEISNVMVWRYVGQRAASDTINTKYSLCDATDRTNFWNPADSSEGPYALQLKKDGYKILNVGNFELPASETNPCSSQAINQIKNSNFTNTSSNSSTLNVQFLTAVNATAQLYKVNSGGTNTLVSSYDYSSQLNDTLTIQLNGLELNAQYLLQLTLQNPNSMTNITNEIKFVLQIK